MKNNFIINRNVEIPQRKFERTCSEITQIFKDFLHSNDDSMSITFETKEEMLKIYGRLRRYHVNHQLKIVDFRREGETLYIFKREKETKIINDKGMRNKIKEAMRSVALKNYKSNFMIVQNEKETYMEDIYALDAFLKTIEMSKKGNVKCYTCPSGKKFYPIFTVTDGVMRLCGWDIQ